MMAHAREVARIEYEASADLCADVTSDQLATMGEWLERAAASGDPGAQLCYAALAGGDDVAPARYSDAWIEWMQRYRLQATPFAENALAAGYWQAAWFLYDVNAGPYAFPMFRIDRSGDSNLSTALSMMLLQVETIERRHDADLDGLLQDFRAKAAVIEGDLSPEQIAQAKAAAAAYAARWRAQPQKSPPCWGLDFL